MGHEGREGGEGAVRSVGEVSIKARRRPLGVGRERAAATAP